MTEFVRKHTEHARLFKGDLEPGEKVVWTGRPGRKSWNSPDVYIIPFGLLVLTFCTVFVLGISGLLSPGHQISWFALMGIAAIPGFRAGYSFAFYPILSRLIYLPNTYLAVTDKRLLVLCVKPWHSLEQVSIIDIAQIVEVSDDRNGSLMVVAMKDGNKKKPIILTDFADLDDVTAVHELIDTMRDPASLLEERRLLERGTEEERGKP